MRDRADFEKARTQELLNNYEQTILVAFLEVEDQLIAAQTFALEFEQRASQVVAARDAVEMSQIRYNGGLTSYLEYLESQRSLFSAELVASETLRLRLTSIVSLYAALGGGWQVAEEDAEAEEEAP